MTTHRAKRRSAEERADILRGIKRGEDGKPEKGQVEKAARKVGVSKGTIYGWISRDGWPDDSPVEAAERLASGRLSLQAARTSGQGRGRECGRVPHNRESDGLQAGLVHLQASPKQELVARWIAGGRSIAETARAAGMKWDTVKRWSTQPGIVVDLIGEFRAVSRAQVQAEATSVVVQSMKATADGYSIASDIHREWLTIRHRLAELKAGAEPEPMEPSQDSYRERLDALRGQYLTAVKALEPSRKTTLQSVGLLDGGLAGALGDEDGGDPLGGVDDLSTDALDALAESALRRIQGG